MQESSNVRSYHRASPPEQLPGYEGLLLLGVLPPLICIMKSKFKRKKNHVLGCFLVCISMHNVYEPGTHEGQKEHWIPQELELQIVWKLPHGYPGPSEEHKGP